VKMLFYLALILIGMVFGVLLYFFFCWKNMRIGTIRINEFDEDGPYLFLEANRSIRDISGKPWAIVEIAKSTSTHMRP